VLKRTSCHRVESEPGSGKVHERKIHITAIKTQLPGDFFAGQLLEQTQIFDLLFILQREP
jgi:hypothetical protein